MKVGLLQVTKDCNQDCVYCTRDKGLIFPTLNNLKNKIDSFQDIDQIIITGGEPLLRDDIFEIIEYAAKKSKVHLQTNGTLITEEIATRLENSGLNSILLHIQTTKKSIFQELSRSKQEFLDEKFKALNLLSKTNIKTGVVFVVNSLNYNELFELSQKIFSISEKFYFQITNMIRFSNNLNDILPLVTPLEKFKEELNKTLRFCDTNNYEVRIDGVPLCYIEEKYHKYVSDLKTFHVDFDQKFIDKSIQYDDQHYNGKERTYFEKCNNCPYFEKCKGYYAFYKEYYELEKLKNSNKEMPRIDLRVGYLCNNNCLYCCVGKEGKAMKSTIQIVNDLLVGRQSGAMKVSFTGGEPTIRKDIFYIVEKAKALGYHEVQVITNGRMLSYKSFFDKLISSGANHIAFSLDSLNEEIQDNLANSKGDFKQLMKAIEHSKMYPKIIYTTITVINKLNYKELPKITQFLIDLKKDLPFLFSEFMFISPEGNALQNKELLIPRITDVIEYVHNSLDLAIENNYPLNVEAIPLCYMQGYEDKVVELHMADERIAFNVNDTDRNYNETRKTQLKAKSNKCKQCKKYLICEGVHRKYLELFGDEELKPI